MSKVFYWKQETSNRPWHCSPDTPEAKGEAIKKGAMFFTWQSLSEPYKGNGQPEPIRYGNLPLDFDDAIDPGKAVKEMKEFCLVHLREYYDIDPYDIDFFLSGGKGCHADLPAKIFNAQNGDPYHHLIYKKIASEWKEKFGLNTLDTSLYAGKKGKMFRLPNVKRSNGCYKVPISLEELRDLPADDLLELAKAPREIESIREEILESPELEALYRNTRAYIHLGLESLPKPVEISEEDRERLSKGLPACIGCILSKMPEKSGKVNFNRLVMNVINYFQMAGWDEQKAWEKARSFVEQYPYSETYDTVEKRASHWRSEWQYLSNNDTYTFNCSYIRGLGLPGTAFECSNCIDTEEDFRPLTPKDTELCKTLLVKPDPPEPLILYNDSPIMTKGIVGALMAAGGTGKSFFMLWVAHAMASGGSVGPLHVQGCQKVLVLCGEDGEDELKRRLWELGDGSFPEGLYAASIVGKVGPLMMLDSNNPVKAPAWDWLRETVKNHVGLDVLMLDPKSRFFGLNENDNDHATQWIACLEALSQEFNLTILFSHHASKQRASSLTQDMSRGASAIVDGCRWVAGMTMLSDNAAKRYGINDPKNYIEFDITKTNYAAQLPQKLIFRRTENGSLEYARLEMDRSKRLRRFMYDLLAEDSGRFSRSELKKGEGDCRGFLEAIKEEFPDFNRSRELNEILDDLKDGLLLTEYEVKNNEKGRAKKVLSVLPIDTGNLLQTWI